MGAVAPKENTVANTDEQIADIRERVASIETTVSYIQKHLDAKTGGNVVLPVALVITVLEIVKAVVERFA